MSSKGYELVQLAKSLVVDANGTITDLDIDTTNIEELVNIDLSIAPEVLEIQVSAPQAGQDTQWLWTWLTSSLPYARRTITNSPEVQVPLYKQGTYTVNNYAAYDLFDAMTQTHSLYLKWIDGAGTDNLIDWAVSSGPVSDTHPDINSGNPTDVQRINISVPATITLPTLTPPSVSYTVTNNGAGAYTFSGAAKGDNPNLGPFYRGGTYTINITATGHPLYFTTDNGTNFASGSYFGEYTDGVTGSRTESGTITFTVPSDAPDTLYYQCGNHSAMRGAITVKNLEVETNINGNYIVYFQHTQEGHKTPVELRPIPSLVNQMCIVYDASVGKFVPQDLATYVENTPSFENKIREVAGTAELVVEDGSAVVAKVNVYADSTYLPLVGNNAGDQAFATDTNKLYIWDGSAWQLSGAANTGELAEGTNLYYTDARVASYLSSNDFDTATNIVASITDSAPATLDTLNELAAALGDDPNFATTVTNSIATKLNSADFNSTFDTQLATKTTDDVAEGSNLYFLYDRVRSATINAGSLRGTVNNATVQYGTSYSGTPVQGSFFFDSLNQKLKVYTGSAFVDAVPAGAGGGGGGGETAANATFRKYTYSITSGTNAVSGADDASETLSYVTDGTQNVEVYVNGVKQVEGASNDYVATTGTSVTFVDNLSSGDVVDIQVYELLTNDAFYLKTETYTQTEVNSQISTGLSSYLPLGGGTMSGPIDSISYLTINEGSQSTYRLKVSGNNGNGTGFAFMDDWGIVGNNYDGHALSRLNFDGGGNSVIQQYNSAGVKTNEFNTNGDSYFNGGNFGIGTSNPQGIFHIESAGDIILGDPTGFGNANKTRIHSQYGGIQYDALQIRNETATIQGRGAGISFWGGSNASRIAGVVASTSDTNDLTKGRLSLYATDYVDFDSSSAIRIARGTNSERPASPSAGMIRFNTTSSTYEGWTGTEWTILSNTSSIVSTGLLANFQPNNISDGSTSWTDSTGNYTFSQLNAGSGSIVKDGAESWYGSGGAPGFKSAGDYSALRFGTGNFTLECWVYFSTTTYGTWKYILGKSTFWDANSYGFYIDSAGTKVGFHWTSGNGTEVNLSGLGVGWHHLAAVGSGGNSIKFYIDGNLEASATPSYNLTSTAQISFNGDEGSYHMTSNDRFGSARWYNIALTSEQINQNRNAEIARY